MVLDASSKAGRSQSAPLARGWAEQCLWLTLEVRPTQTDHDLILTASFGRGRRDLLDGSVDFGLTEITLRCNVKNGIVPVGSRWPEIRWLEGAIVRRTQAKEHAETQKATRSVDGGVLESKPTVKLSTGRESGEEIRRGIQDEFDFLVPRVMSTGSPTAPGWWFQVLPGEDYLRGNLVNQVIGSLQIDSKNCQSAINAKCELVKHSVKVIDSDGLLVGLAANSKLMVLRALVRNAIFDELISSLKSIELKVTAHG